MLTVAHLLQLFQSLNLHCFPLRTASSWGFYGAGKALGRGGAENPSLAMSVIAQSKRHPNFGDTCVMVLCLVDSIPLNFCTNESGGAQGSLLNQLQRDFW